MKQIEGILVRQIEVPLYIDGNIGVLKGEGTQGPRTFGFLHSNEIKVTTAMRIYSPVQYLVVGYGIKKALAVRRAESPTLIHLRQLVCETPIFRFHSQKIWVHYRRTVRLFYLFNYFEPAQMKKNVDSMNLD